MRRLHWMVGGFSLLAAAQGCSLTGSTAVTPGQPPTNPFSGTAGGNGCLASSGGAIGTAGVMGTPQFGPHLGSTYTQAVAPPAISGGTLLVLADGTTAVAADSDRDSVSIVDLTTRTVRSTVALQPGDEPGRLAEDAAGRVHVALRHGGALVTIDPTAGQIISRRPVCAAPRGVAYDPASDQVHVACHDGQLVSLPAAGGDPVRRLQLDDDLRDVVVDGDTLLVTRFRSAQVISIASDGTVTGRVQPLNLSSSQVRSGSLYTPSTAWRALPAPGGGAVMLHQRGMYAPVVPAAGGYGGPGPCDTIVHSCITRVGRDGSVSSGAALPTMVLTVDMAISPDGKQVAVVAAGNATNTDLIGDGVTPALPRVFLTDLDSATSAQYGCMPDGTHGPCLPADLRGGFPSGGFGGSTGTGGSFSGGAGGSPMTGCCASGAGGAGGFDSAAAGGSGGATGLGGAPMTGCCATGAGGAVATATGGAPPHPTGGASGMGGRPNLGGSPGFAGSPGSGGSVCPSPPHGVPDNVGQPIAVAFDGSGGLIVQSREPAMLAMADGTTIALSPISRADTGHTLFHADSGGFLACASCHAEGTEDGRVWNFSCIGPRRTQSLQTGLAGTEPFHWDGEETDFPHLMTDVFQGRMSGPTLTTGEQGALLAWLDAQPRIAQPAPPDAAAVARGQALFNDPAHGCALCHAGPNLTNNQTVDVGTGGKFQVPSLVGVANRAPYMHNGCAPTLADRFGSCGGGDQHGVTSTLSADDVSDLVAYLKTL